MKRQKQDNEVMTLLKLKEISRIICDTDMGTLKLRLRKGESEYHFVLDAVELPKELNKELFEAIYPVEEPLINGYVKPVILTPKQEKIIADNSKPKGRPKGSKNKISG